MQHRSSVNTLPLLLYCVVSIVLRVANCSLDAGKSYSTSAQSWLQHISTAQHTS